MVPRRLFNIRFGEPRTSGSCLGQPADPTEEIQALTGDPKKDDLQADAVVGEADYLVSGNDDRLNLEEAGQVKIVPPANSQGKSRGPRREVRRLWLEKKLPRCFNQQSNVEIKMIRETEKTSMPSS